MPLFAVGVFVGFTLLTFATTIIELVSKFTEGAWLIVLIIPGLALLSLVVVPL